MQYNLNKSFNQYLTDWAFVTKNTNDLQSLLTYINLFYSNYLSPFSSNEINFNSSDTSILQNFLPHQIHFFFVELSLLNLSPNHRKVLSLRYVDNLPWDIISFKMHFSRRSCFYLRKDVLISLNKIHNYFCTSLAPFFTNLSL